MDNSITNCSWYVWAASTSRIPVYFILGPICFVLGIVGHSLCLAAFHSKATKQPPYNYQIFLTIIDLIHTVYRLFYYVTFQALAGSTGSPGYDWFMSCYACMWVVAHTSYPISDILYTCSEFLSIAILADRVFALARPFAYKNTNRKLHQVSALLICIALSAGTSLQASLVLKLDDGTNGNYHMSTNFDFITSNAAKICAQVRNALRLFGLVLLFILNVVLIVLHRTRMRKTAATVGVSDEKAERIKEQEKVLLLLAVFQGVFETVSATGVSFMLIISYITPAFQPCVGPFAIVVVDAIEGICDTLQFYVFFAINRKFRSMIFQTVPCFKKLSSTLNPSSVTNKITNKTRTHNAGRLPTVA